jgi:hypothetical protein
MLLAKVSHTRSPVEREEEIAHVTRSTIDIVNRRLSWAREKLRAPTPCSEFRERYPRAHRT